jgi:hypothetical protein
MPPTTDPEAALHDALDRAQDQTDAEVAAAEAHALDAQADADAHREPAPPPDEPPATFAHRSDAWRAAVASDDPIEQARFILEWVRMAPNPTERLSVHTMASAMRLQFGWTDETCLSLARGHMPPLPDDPAQDGDVGTDLAIPEGGTVAQQLPEASVWQQLRQMAQVFANSNLVSSALRGKPDDVTLIMVKGHEVGLPPTVALSKIFIVDGKPSMAADTMKALVVRAGHRMWKIHKNEERATVGYQRRRDDGTWGPEQTVTWTMEDAKRAKLAAKDNWVQYPRHMLWARAVSEAAVEEFSDVLGGMTYTPEALGAIIDVDGEEVTYRDPAADADQEDFAAGTAGRMEILAKIQALPPDVKAKVREAWTAAAAEGKVRMPSQLRRSDLAYATALLKLHTADVQFTAAAASSQTDAEAPIADAEVVEEPEAAVDPDERTFTCTECGRLVQGHNEAGKHEPGCGEAPF